MFVRYNHKNFHIRVESNPHYLYFVTNKKYYNSNMILNIPQPNNVFQMLGKIRLKII